MLSLDCIGQKLSIQIISINNKYFNGLINKYQNAKTKLQPYFNKKLDNSPFYRPYLCLNNQKNFKFLKLFPLSTYKQKDYLEAKHLKYIVIRKKIVAKIVLSCGLIVPKNQTTWINLSKISLKKCKKPFKERLIDLKDELQFCIKNYKFIIYAIKNYEKLNNTNKNKYPMLDKKINLDYNRDWANKKINK